MFGKRALGQSRRTHVRSIHLIGNNSWKVSFILRFMFILYLYYTKQTTWVWKLYFWNKSVIFSLYLFFCYTFLLGMVQTLFCRNELLLPSSSFGRNSAVTIRIVSAEVPGFYSQKKCWFVDWICLTWKLKEYTNDHGPIALVISCNWSYCKFSQECLVPIL